MIYLLTAPIQSGKTTSLVNWSAERNDVYGILTPVVNGKRVFMNAQTKEQFAMEASGDGGSITVGKYLFSKKAFEKAAEIIRAGINKEGWLVIDEIGPLELRGEGFCDVLKEVLAVKKEKLVLVVREGMGEQVKKYFNINEAEEVHDTTTIKKLRD